MQQVFNGKAAQVISFFQTSRKVLYFSSLIAFVLALLIFPIWHQIFTYHNLPVSIQMATLEAQYVKVFWDDPIQHPTAYESIHPVITVPPTQSQFWQVKVEALGLSQKNPQSKWSQVWILDISTPKSRIDWSKAVMEGQKWDLRDNPSGPQGKVALANSGKPQALNVLIDRGDLTVKLRRSDGSGRARVSVNGLVVSEVDLFENGRSVETLTFKPEDESLRSYQINAVDTPWRRLKFVAEGESKLKIKQVKVREQTLTIPANGEVILPFKLWNRLSCTVVSTIISFLWMTILFISAVHLWQRQSHKRFGTLSYIATLAVTVGGFWMLVFYPASMNGDSFGFWQQALWNRYNTWYPPLISMLMHVTQFFTKSPSLFTFIQATLFWGAIFYIIRQVVRDDRFFLFGVFLMIALPSLWSVSAALLIDIWTATFALLSAAFMIKAARRESNKLLLISVLLLSLSVCFRHNAFILVLAPIVVCQLYFWGKISFWKKASKITLIVLLVLLPSKIVERLPNVNLFTPVGVVLINQYVGTVINAAPLKEAEIQNERNSIDQQFGTGTFEQLLANYNCGNGDYIRLAKPPIISSEKLIEESSFIVGKVVSIAPKHPTAYVKHKLCNISRTFQVSRVFAPFYYGIAPNKIGIQSKSRIPKVNHWIISTLQSTFKPLTFLFRTWVYIGFLVLALIVNFRKRVELFIPSLFGISYALSYLIADAYPSWRYLLLSYICGWVVIIGMVDYIISKIKFKNLHQTAPNIS